MPENFRNNERIIQKVWEKGLIIQNLDPDIYRKDQHGSLIKRDMYMKYDKSSYLGWEIDHIERPEHGGTNDISNLQPLHGKTAKIKTIILNNRLK